MTLELDDLLERRYNNIATLELDQVTLGGKPRIRMQRRNAMA